MSRLFDSLQLHLNQKAIDDQRLLSGAFWAELRVFLAVAKMKSFNRAAAALNISQPTVSRYVKRLQDMLGSQLVVPTSNGIKLTLRGEELANALSGLDRQLLEMSNDLRFERSDAEGLVRVSITEGLAGLFVAPKLAQFVEKHPKLRLHIANPTNMAFLKENQTDILVNFSREASSDVSSHRCGNTHLLPIASKDYVRRFGVPTERSLEDHWFVDSTYYSGPSRVWAGWRDAVDQASMVQTCDNSFAYGLMVKASMGIGLLGNYALADGDAIAIDIGVHITLPIYVHAMTERCASRPVRLVYDWLTEIFSPEVPWFQPEMDFENLPKQALSPILSQLILSK